ncbi:sugar-transfer associated ATP-grasp domain-containing protein [Vibrio breoganii]
MKTVFRRFIELCYEIIRIIIVFKIYFFEVIEIYRKRKLYSQIKWTREEQLEFDDYWKKILGYKISNRWHRLYQSVNGKFDIEYIPEWMYTVKLETLYNPMLKSRLLEDKSLCEILFFDEGQRYRFPKTVIVRDGDYFYDEKRQLLSIDRVEEIILSKGLLIIKPSVGGSSGNDVKLLNSDDLLQELLNNKSYTQCIVQEKVEQSTVLSSLNPSSLNTFRVITYICDSKIHHCPISLRIGGGHSHLDNIHAGGMVVHVKDDGTLGNYAYKLGWGDSQEKYDIHPVSNIVFEEYTIPQIKSIISAAYIAHTKLTGITMVSWDFALDYNNVPTLIEANLLGQSVWFPQIVSGRPLFGNRNKSMVKPISKVKM